MFSRKQSTGQDYPKAAKKHCNDASVLLDSQRFDGAAYLAGYAQECILKTIIQVEENHFKPITKYKHDLEELGGRVLELIKKNPNTRTARYFATQFQSNIPYGPPPSGWKEELRYYPENTIPDQNAKQWVLSAEQLYQDVIGALMKDGVVNG
ncbi:MAG: hypothetical protein ACM3SY_17830 [Candidatus Omnitrophota bacterium]